MAPTTFDITIGPHAGSHDSAMLLDGHPVTGVHAVEIRAAAGEATQLTVYHLGNAGRVQGVADVEHVHLTTADRIAEFIRGLDPGEVQGAAIGLGLGGDHTAAVLAHVAALVEQEFTR